jgi:hypothetical protein
VPLRELATVLVPVGIGYAIGQPRPLQCKKAKTKSDSDGKVLESLKEETRAMTQEQKVIRAKVGVLELAKQLGNVPQACRVMATAATASSASRTSTTRAARRAAGDLAAPAGVEESRRTGG